MSEIRKKLAELSNGESSMWAGKARLRSENRIWLKKSQAIAFEVLEALDEKGLTQKKLAAMMKVTPQFINTIVKGNVNLTLETISRLEKALGIQLISIVTFETGIAKRTQKVSAKLKKSSDRKAA